MKGREKKISLTQVFDALRDPARLAIVQYLLDKKELSCGECKLPLSKSTMSHHFKVLLDAGILKKREAGRTHHLSVCTRELEKSLPGLIALLKRTRG